jgi:exonuclease VII small subunit
MGLILLVWVILQVMGTGPSLISIVSGLLAVVLGGRMVWRFIQRGSLARTACVTDSRGDLKDEIKTAYSFIRENRSSAWIDHQIRGAQDTMRRLDPALVAPVTLPKRLLFADALILLVAAVTLTTAPWLVRNPSHENASMSDVERQAKEIGDLLQPPGAAGEILEEPQIEAVQRLDDTIRRLESGEISLDEGLQEIQETENLLTEAGLDMATIQEDLEDIAGDMEGEGPLGDVAEALENQNLMEAAELLRALAEKALEASYFALWLKKRWKASLSRASKSFSNVWKMRTNVRQVWRIGSRHSSKPLELFSRVTLRKRRSSWRTRRKRSRTWRPRCN